MKNGFTLVEFLVVISIILILTTITLANYRGGEAQFALERSAHKLAQDLRMAKEMTMSMQEISGCISPVNCGYGLYFDSANSYRLFVNRNVNRTRDGGEDLEEIFLERGINIHAISPSTPLSILFTPPDPIVWINGLSGSAEIILRSPAGRLKRVTINSSGLIEVRD